MSYTSDIDRFTLKLKSRIADVVTDAALEVQNSIKFGSALTGAPGQPVGQYPQGSGKVGGNLRESFHLTREDKYHATVATKVVYAKGIEEGISGATGRPITIRSTVGGIGSIKMVRAAWQRIVDQAVRRQGGG